MNTDDYIIDANGSWSSPHDSGASLQETLAAVYLSGCENALVATKAAGGEG